MPNYKVEPSDPGVQPAPVLKPSTGHLPTTFAQFIKSAHMAGENNDLDSHVGVLHEKANAANETAGEAKKSAKGAADKADAASRAAQGAGVAASDAATKAEAAANKASSAETKAARAQGTAENVGHAVTILSENVTAAQGDASNAVTTANEAEELAKRAEATARNAVQPRLRGIDSNDLRTPPAKSYSQKWSGTGSVHVTDKQLALQWWTPTYPDHPEGYDDERPGLVVEKLGLFQPTRTDWTAENAGSTEREFDATVRLVPANERGYSDDETLTVWLGHFENDHFVVNPNDTGHTFKFRGGRQDPFEITFRVKMTGPPRAKGPDKFAVYLKAGLGHSGETTAITLSSYSLTYSLPHLGANDSQAYNLKYSIPQAGISQELMPPEVPAKDGTYFLCDLDKSGDDHEGISTSPGQTDKAEVTSERWPDFNGSGPNILTAARDLRRVRVRVKSSAPVGKTGVLYLVSWIPGRRDYYLAGTLAIDGKPFDVTFPVNGVVMGQRLAFFTDRQIDNAGDIGKPQITWDPSIDASLGTHHQVLKGLKSTYVANFNKSLKEFAIGLDVPDHIRWDAVRVVSSGLTSSLAWPPNFPVVPAEAGSPSETHPAVGHVMLHGNGLRDGKIYGGLMLGLFKDAEGYKFSVYLTDANRMTDAWIDRVEIDYS